MKYLGDGAIQLMLDIYRTLYFYINLLVINRLCSKQVTYN